MIKDLVRRFIVIVIIIAFYFIVIRPIRSLIIRRLIYPTVKTVAPKNSGFKVSFYNKVTIQLLTDNFEGKPKEYMYKIVFGGFLLLSAIFLVGLNIGWKWLGWVFGFHCVIFILETGMLFGGLGGFYFLLSCIKLLNQYIVPAFSFGIVAFAWYQRKNEKSFLLETSAFTGP